MFLHQAFLGSMCPISTGCHMDQITPQVDLPVQAVPDTTGTAPALNLKRRPNLYRERHCIWFSYPLELPGIIRSYESYVIYIFWKKLEGHSVSILYDWSPEEIQ